MSKYSSNNVRNSSRKHKERLSKRGSKSDLSESEIMRQPSTEDIFKSFDIKEKDKIRDKKDNNKLEVIMSNSGAEMEKIDKYVAQYDKFEKISPIDNSIEEKGTIVNEF